MKDKKSRIDTYETPYGVYLVVANIYTTLEELKQLYTYSNGEELDNEIITDSVATTSQCKRKSDNALVVLVKYNSPCEYETDKQLSIIHTAAHEATHVMLDIYSFIHAKVDFDNQETLAWEISWVTICILKTWLNK